MNRKLLHCKRCGYSWHSRKEVVKICAKCKSPYWDVNKLDHTMYKITDTQLVTLDQISKKNGKTITELLDCAIQLLEMESITNPSTYKLTEYQVSRLAAIGKKKEESIAMLIERSVDLLEVVERNVSPMNTYERMLSWKGDSPQ